MMGAIHAPSPGAEPAARGGPLECAARSPSVRLGEAGAARRRTSPCALRAGDSRAPCAAPSSSSTAAPDADTFMCPLSTSAPSASLLQDGFSRVAGEQFRVPTTVKKKVHTRRDYIVVSAGGPSSALLGARRRRVAHEENLARPFALPRAEPCRRRAIH